VTDAELRYRDLVTLGPECDEVARASSPRGEVVLRRRGKVLELRVNGVFVMDTAETSTERALARGALDALACPRDVLVGGLGLGFTAREVLADSRVETLTVVEIEPAVIGWLRDGLAGEGSSLFGDERCRVVEGDLRDFLAAEPDASYDLVLLDVDNGPDFLVYETNAALYETSFLRQARRVLRPESRLAVWSSSPSTVLDESLRLVFGSASSTPHAVRLQSRGETYWLSTATRRFDS
jgi:spermidine synthase